MNTRKVLIFIWGVAIWLFYFIFFEIPGYLNITALFKKDDRSFKKVAFQAYSPHHAQVLLPVITRIKKEKGMEVYFIVMFHPYYGFKGLKDMKAYAMNVLKIKETNVKYIWRALWDKYDCLICMDVYAKFPVIKCKKVLVPHGTGFSLRTVTKSLLRKSVHDFDYYFVSGDFDFFRAKRHIKEKPILYRAGFPFADPLIKRNEKEKSYEALGIDKHNTILLFAPNWGATHQYGDVLGYYFDRTMECLLARDLTVLIKLHAASFNKSLSMGVVWESRLKKYADHSKVRLIDDLNDIPYFLLSDILITDISSRSPTFMLLDRPVIITGVPQDYFKTLVNKDQMEKFLEGAYFAEDEGELDALLDRCIKNPGEMSQQRRKVVHSVFSFPGSGTERYLNLIKEIIS